MSAIELQGSMSPAEGSYGPTRQCIDNPLVLDARCSETGHYNLRQIRSRPSRSTARTIGPALDMHYHVKARPLTIRGPKFVKLEALLSRLFTVQALRPRTEAYGRSTRKIGFHAVSSCTIRPSYSRDVPDSTEQTVAKMQVIENSPHLWSVYGCCRGFLHRNRHLSEAESKCPGDIVVSNIYVVQVDLNFPWSSCVHALSHFLGHRS